MMMIIPESIGTVPLAGKEDNVMVTGCGIQLQGEFCTEGWEAELAR